jgi:hypothetical protein
LVANAADGGIKCVEKGKFLDEKSIGKSEYLSRCFKIK